MLQFNLRGLLVSETIISSTLEELEAEFVVKLNDGNRSALFAQYQAYCKDLKELIGNKPLTQWIDGSYVTKSKNPSDIDLVTFIDYNDAKTRQDELKRFVSPKSMELYGVDGYIIIVYPENNKSYFLNHFDRTYWIDHFGKTKPNRQRKRIAKGFLE